MKTWEDTIRFIRSQAEYGDLVKHSYLGEDLRLNTERFKSSEEFRETLKIVKEFAPGSKTLLDIGAGNGISSLAFALSGYDVTVIKPDPSSTVGCGAIEILKEEFGLKNINVFNSFGESLPFERESFDIVYTRQAMHHAADLNAFIGEAARVLKPNGLFLTIRDHVIYGAKDKQQFLDTHPLQKFYGGENAFTLEEYKSAFMNSGLAIKRHLKYYDSVINFFPASENDIQNAGRRIRDNFRQSLQKRFGSMVVNFPFLPLLERLSIIKNGAWIDERRIPGRMHSFIMVKAGS